MNYADKLSMIRYALGKIKVQGRESLEAVLLALRKLNSGEEEIDFKAIQSALNLVTVSGEDDINHLLACIQMLDDLIEEGKKE